MSALDICEDEEVELLLSYNCKSLFLFYLYSIHLVYMEYYSV